MQIMNPILGNKSASAQHVQQASDEGLKSVFLPKFTSFDYHLPQYQCHSQTNHAKIKNCQNFDDLCLNYQ